MSGDAKRVERDNIEQIDPAELADFTAVLSITFFSL